MRLLVLLATRLSAGDSGRYNKCGFAGASGQVLNPRLRLFNTL
jgi:hypothetical protein